MSRLELVSSLKMKPIPQKYKLEKTEQELYRTQFFKNDNKTSLRKEKDLNKNRFFHFSGSEDLFIKGNKSPSVGRSIKCFSISLKEAVSAYHNGSQLFFLSFFFHHHHVSREPFLGILDIFP